MTKWKVTKWTDTEYRYNTRYKFGFINKKITGWKIQWVINLLSFTALFYWYEHTWCNKFGEILMNSWCGVATCIPRNQSVRQRAILLISIVRWWRFKYQWLRNTFDFRFIVRCTRYDVQMYRYNDWWALRRFGSRDRCAQCGVEQRSESRTVKNVMKFTICLLFNVIWKLKNGLRKKKSIYFALEIK